MVGAWGLLMSWKIGEIHEAPAGSITGYGFGILDNYQRRSSRLRTRAD